MLVCADLADQTHYLDVYTLTHPTYGMTILCTREDRHVQKTTATSAMSSIAKTERHSLD